MTRTDRGVSPVVGAVLVVAVTVALAGTAGMAAMSAAGDPPTDPPRARFDVTASASGRVSVVHRGGETVDVGAIRLRITVDGQALRHQPPVPYFAARGFRGGPTGPFNLQTENRWTAGERGSVWVASTNDPTVRTGSRVEVELYAEGSLIHRSTAIAGGASRLRSGRRRRHPRGRFRARVRRS